MTQQILNTLQPTSRDKGILGLATFFLAIALLAASQGGAF